MRAFLFEQSIAAPLLQTAEFEQLTMSLPHESRNSAGWRVPRYDTETLEGMMEDKTPEAQLPSIIDASASRSPQSASEPLSDHGYLRYLEELQNQHTMPPPVTPAADDAHQQLLDSIDLALKHRPFRKPNWKPSARRNKNIKQIIGEASRKEASVLATQNNSGTSTPMPLGSAIGTGAATPLPTNGTLSHPNIAQAAQNLSTLVLERNLQASMSSGPVATYTNIESAPSLHPAHQKPYCDITGLPAPYTDPKTRLRYHNKEVFDVVRSLPQGVAEKYLEARGAHVVLK